MVIQRSEGDRRCERLAGQYRRQRLSDMALGSSLLGIIGALAVSLASVGLYAVIAFSVGQRNREIGIRIALGAAQRQVVRLFVCQGLRLAAVGLIIGAARADEKCGIDEI